MRTFRQLCAAFVLTLTLALSAFAGDISTTVVSQPPPSTSQAAMTQGDISTTVTGEISTGVTATDSATEFVLNLILGVFSLI
jgi:hypothetical protein